MNKQSVMDSILTNRQCDHLEYACEIIEEIYKMAYDYGDSTPVEEESRMAYSIGRRIKQIVEGNNS